MERVFVHLLVPGRVLGAPLYDVTGCLLLADGEVLTEDMMMAILRSHKPCVYLGEWNAAELERYKSATPLSAYSEIARQMGHKLELEMEKALKGQEVDVKPRGSAFEEEIDHSLQKNRLEGRLQEWERTHQEAVGSVKDISQGLIEDSKVAEVVTNVVTKLVKSCAVDVSLFGNLTNIKGENEYIYTHSVNTSILSINIASALQLDSNQVREVGIAALLVNLGMAMVADDIVNTQRELTQVEFIDIQKHISYGLYALKKFRGLPYSARLVLYQNKERADGSGYPKRRKKEAIHKFAKIVAVADVYDAMTTDRPWRKAHPPYRVMEHLIRNAQTKFDGEIVRGLLKYLSLFPIGTLVKLSSGEVARVVHSNFDEIARPVVSVLYDADEKPCSSPCLLDLAKEETLRVDSVIEDELNIGLNEGF